VKDARAVPVAGSKAVPVAVAVNDPEAEPVPLSGGSS